MAGSARRHYRAVRRAAASAPDKISATVTCGSNKKALIMAVLTVVLFFAKGFALGFTAASKRENGYSKR